MPNPEMNSSPRRDTIKNLAVGRSDLFRVDPHDIVVKPGWNCRDTETDEYKEGIAELAKSIATVGVKQALTV